MRHRLAQGEAVIRPAGPADRELLLRFYESLDPETVYMRFLHPVKDFSRHVELVLGPLNRYGVVALAELAGGAGVAGVGELVAKERAAGEVAVTVAREYRRQGLGTKLAAYLAYAAYVRGVERLEAYISSENVAARRIAERLGLRMEYVGMGVYRVRVRVLDVVARAREVLGLA